MSKPQIRFEDYDEDWLEEKVSRLFFISTGTNVPNEINGKYYNLTMGSITDKGEMVLLSKTNSNKNLLTKGMLVMPTRDIGEGRIIGRTALVERDDCFAGNCLYVLDIKQGDASFANFEFNSSRSRKYYHNQMQGGGQKQIILSDVKEQLFLLPPKKDEQIVRYPINWTK